MVKEVNLGGKAPKIPDGYSAIQLYDEKTKKSQVYFVPVGQKISYGESNNMRTFDPSQLRNNQVVITGTKGDKNFEMIGLALEHMDVNNDGRIDVKDTNDNIGAKINKDKDMPNGYFVDQLDPDTYRAFVYKGEGSVQFSQKHMDENPYSVDLDDGI